MTVSVIRDGTVIGNAFCSRLRTTRLCFLAADITVDGSSYQLAVTNANKINERVQRAWAYDYI